MEQQSNIWDVALWRLPSSDWAEIVAWLAVDEWTLPFEAVQALMQDHKETYVYKATVGMPGRIERYWHVKLPRQIEMHIERVPVNEVVNALCSLVEEEGADLVEVDAGIALGLLDTLASIDPAGLFARWRRVALANDERAFADRWNDRRSALVRARLAQEEEKAMVRTRR